MYYNNKLNKFIKIYKYSAVRTKIEFLSYTVVAEKHLQFPIMVNGYYCNNINESKVRLLIYMIRSRKSAILLQ